MKTRNFFPFLILIMMFVGLFVTDQNAKASGETFIRYFDSTTHEISRLLLELDDGSFIMGGITYNHPGPDSNYMISKLESDGTVIWTKVIGGTGGERIEQAIQTADGGFLLIGDTSSYGAGDFDIFVVKLNSSGIEQWSKTIGGAAYDDGFSVVQTSDGGFTLVGRSRSYGGSDYDIIVSRLNSTGVEQWTKTIGGSAEESVRRIVQTSDGGYAIMGNTYSFGGAEWDYFIVKINSSGIEQWSKLIGGTGIDFGYALLEAPDGGIVFTGNTGSYGSANYDLIVSKLNSSGIEQWTKTYHSSGHSSGNDIKNTSDGGFIVTGYGDFNGNYDTLLLKLDSSGGVTWHSVFGDSGSDDGTRVIQTSDGGYALVGNTTSYGGSDYEMLMIKVDSSGEIPDCTSLSSPTLVENDVTLTETDIVITEQDETVTEADETVTEQDVTILPANQINLCYDDDSLDQAGIEVNIADVIALDCGADVDFGTVTPGTPVSAETTCTATTNAETGYTLQVKREDADTTMDHTTDDTANIIDKTAWTGTGGTTDTWTGTGLGFAVYASSTGSKNTTDWGTGTACHDALNEYTGLPDTYQSILSHSAYAAAGTTTSVCYRVDIPANQKSGSYDGVVVYQVYTNP